MHFLRRFVRLILAFLLSGLPATLADSNTVAVEAIRRLKGADLGANPALKAAIDRVLDQIADQPEFVEVARDFDLKERAPQVLDFLRKHPADSVAIDGMRFVIHHDAARVARELTNDASALALAGLSGRAGGPDTIAALAGIVADKSRDPKVREAAILGLVLTLDGSKQLLRILEAKRLDGELDAVASRELQGVRWPAIKEVAGKLGTRAVASDAPLPAKSDLLKLSGDASRGAAVFRKASVGCPTCHQVNGEGIDFGPRLSEIGAKLGKDALYDAIVEPSAGISFGFEAWLITTQDGEETLGIIASETEDAVLVKLPGGQSIRIQKKEIAKREKQAQSIMPTGLHANLRATEFADLLEYLSGLKKATR